MLKLSFRYVFSFVNLHKNKFQIWWINIKMVMQSEKCFPSFSNFHLIPAYQTNFKDKFKTEMWHLEIKDFNVYLVVCVCTLYNVHANQPNLYESLYSTKCSQHIKPYKISNITSYYTQIPLRSINLLQPTQRSIKTYFNRE